MTAAPWDRGMSRREVADAATPMRAEFRAELHTIYARLPEVMCKGRCQDSCTTVGTTALEHAFADDAGVDLPPGVPHQRHLELIDNGVHLTCPALGPLGNCTVYADRPLLCRSFGSIRTSLCEHGCWPERLMTLTELAALQQQCQNVSDRWEQAGQP